MDKRHFLKTSIATFYDGHGEGSVGETRKTIETHKDYHDLKEGIWYNSDFEESKDEDFDDAFAEDGYHCEIEEFTIKELHSMEEVKKIKKIITDYNQL